MPRAMTCGRIGAAALASLMVAAIPATTSAAPSAELVQVAPQAFESRQPLLGYLTRPIAKDHFRLSSSYMAARALGHAKRTGPINSGYGVYVAPAIDSFTPRNIAAGWTDIRR